MAIPRGISLLGLITFVFLCSSLHAQANNGRPYFEQNGQYYYYDNQPYQQGASDEDPYPSTVPYDSNGSAGYENYDNDRGGVEADQLFDSYNGNNH